MIGFAGLSHLGIVSSIATASKGHDHVIGFDPNGELCADLARGKFPIFEKGLSELLRDATSRIQFTSDPEALKKCGLIYISLDIATDDENRGSLEPFYKLFDLAAAHAPAGAILVVLSQLQPGATRRLLAKIGRELKLFYQVETLIFGNAVERALHPERFIVGCGDPAQPLPAAYNSLLSVFGCPVFQMRYESAELAKISINVCLAASLSVANTMAELCESVGADWSEIVPALKTDKRIGPYSYLVPGLGIGGGNIERDLAAVSDMAKERGTDGGTVDAFLSNSRRRKTWAFNILRSHVPSLQKDLRVAVWGLAYKVDTLSIKNSPSIELIRALGEVPVQAYDPKVVLKDGVLKNCAQVESHEAACRGASALAIMTPWKEFSAVHPADIRKWLAGNLIVDPFRVLNQNECRGLGFSHFVIGA